MLDKKVINSIEYIKVDKAVGIWAIIQAIFWRIVSHGSKNYVEVAMIDVFRKKVVTRRGDDGFIPLEMYKHELVHLSQLEALGRVRFTIEYLASWIYNSIKYLSIMEGYINNRFEVDARRLSVHLVI